MLGLISRAWLYLYLHLAQEEITSLKRSQTVTGWPADAGSKIPWYFRRSSSFFLYFRRSFVLEDRVDTMQDMNDTGHAARDENDAGHAGVAVCMIGAGIRLGLRYKFNLNQQFIDSVITPLGGKDNVDVFVVTEPNLVFGSNELSTQLTQGFEELMEMMGPRSKALNMPYIMYAYDSLLKHDASWYTKGGTNYLERLKDYPQYRCDRCEPQPGCNRTAMSALLHEHQHTLLQHVKLDQCYRRIRANEVKRGFNYTWIMKDRFDRMYKHSFLAGNTTLRDLDNTKVHVPCSAHGFGVCDGCALVPRPFMSSYFSLPFSVVAECWSMDVLYTECFPNNSKNWEENNLVTNGAVYPECFLRLKMMRAGTRMSDYAGAITTNTIVRDCDCDDARVMKPWESCGHVLDHVSRERSHCAVTL